MKKITIFLFVAILTGCSSGAVRVAENMGIPFASSFESNASKQEKKNKAENAAQQQAKERFEPQCKMFLDEINKVNAVGAYSYIETRVNYLKNYKTIEINNCYSRYDYKTDNDVCVVDMTQNPCYIELKAKLYEAYSKTEELNEKKSSEKEVPSLPFPLCKSYLYGVLTYDWKIEEDCLYSTGDNSYSFLAFSQAKDGILFVVQDYRGITIAGPFFAYTKGQYTSGQDIGGYLKYKGEYSYTGIDGFPKKVMAFERYSSVCKLENKDGEVKQICSEIQKQ